MAPSGGNWRGLLLACALTRDSKAATMSWGDATWRGTFLVERLKQSVERLEAPDCPDCHISMEWYRSVLLQTMPATIGHFFMCPNCNRLREIRTRLNTDQSSNP